MAPRRSLAWTELRVGILVIMSFALLAVAIFYVSGQSGFFVRKYSVQAFYQNANNLRSGAEVSLEGVTIQRLDRCGLKGIGSNEGCRGRNEAG